MKSNIRKLRLERDLSQTELGRIIGVSQQIISRMERDRNRMEIDNLIALADYFGVSTDYILGHPEPDKNGKRKNYPIMMDNLDSEKEITELRTKFNDDQMDGLFGLLVNLKHYMAE